MQTSQEQEATAKKNFDDFFQQWWFSILVSVVICITATFPQSTINQLALIHDKVASGEVWRILTSQFVHLGVNHTMLNLVGYLIISVSFRAEITPRREATGLLICTLGVGSGIYLFNPEIPWYVGLSGAIWGMLAHYLVVGWQRAPMLSLIFALYMLVKTLYEQLGDYNDSFTGEAIGGIVAVDSHLYGIVTGIAVGLITLLLKRCRSGGNTKKDDVSTTRN